MSTSTMRSSTAGCSPCLAVQQQQPLTTPLTAHQVVVLLLLLVVGQVHRAQLQLDSTLAETPQELPQGLLEAGGHPQAAQQQQQVVVLLLLLLLTQVLAAHQATSSRPSTPAYRPSSAKTVAGPALQAPCLTRTHQQTPMPHHKLAPNATWTAGPSNL